MAFGLIGGLLVIAAGVALLVLKKMLYVCQPNEVIIFSGRSRRLADGGRHGYRVIRGGRALRIPLFETVDRMDLTNMIIDVEVKGAYSKGGIPLTVQGIANIKVPGEEPLLSNTLERFLGVSRERIMKIARETLEGNLRGVLSTLTPEEVNMDKEQFARQLAEEAEQDLHSLGLVVDTLKIQNVSDEVGYLSSIGRQRSAQIRRDAVVAEAASQAEAAERKWVNHRNGEVARIEAEMQIAIKSNVKRLADARTRRAARIAQEQADVQALVAQAKAEVAMQSARIEQTQLQLQADVLEPAEAARRQSQERAKGEAAQIIEQGRATAEALRELGRTYNEHGSTGREVLLMQKLLPLVRQISGSIGQLRVDRLAVLGAGRPEDGGGAGLAASLVDYAEQIKAATGVDVNQLLARLARPDANGRHAAVSPPNPPSRPAS
ncbi:MAG: flotillin family protein [Myxococcales bacterium FL481]|nr:MAG: flotillin family protein [Myxococcales bacterium FL481]